MRSSVLSRNLINKNFGKVARAAFSDNAGSVTVDLGDDVYTTHNFETPSTSVKTTKEELVHFFKQMYTMRRMEITNDTEYKVSIGNY
jgi:hypothetical protein